MDIPDMIAQWLSLLQTSSGAACNMDPRDTRVFLSLCERAFSKVAQLLVMCSNQYQRMCEDDADLSADVVKNIDYLRQKGLSAYADLLQACADVDRESHKHNYKASDLQKIFAALYVNHQALSQRLTHELLFCLNQQAHAMIDLIFLQDSLPAFMQTFVGLFLSMLRKSSEDLFLCLPDLLSQYLDDSCDRIEVPENYQPVLGQLKVMLSSCRLAAEKPLRHHAGSADRRSIYSNFQSAFAAFFMEPEGVPENSQPESERLQQSDRVEELPDVEAKPPVHTSLKEPANVSDQSVTRGVFSDAVWPFKMLYQGDGLAV